MLVGIRRRERQVGRRVTCVDNILPVGVNGAGCGVVDKLEAGTWYDCRQQVVESLQEGVVIAPEELADCALYEQAIDIGVMEACQHLKQQLKGYKSAEEAVGFGECSQKRDVDCCDDIV